jgi:hypothetical protein
MDTEDMVREALRAELAAVEPGEWPVGAMQDRVRRRQRGRWAVRAVTSAAVVTGVVLGAGMLSTGWGSGREQVGAASASVLPAGTPPAVVVVRPGQRVQLGQGDWMSLTSDEICTHIVDAYGGGPGCGGWSWAAGTTGINLQYEDGVYQLAYYGSEQVTRLTIEVDGTTYWVTPVVLAGTHSYTTGYVRAPLPSAARGPQKNPPKKSPIDGITMVAYGAGGKVLATSTTTS